MLIDLEKYAEITMGKLDKVDYYSELSREETQNVVLKQLTKVYDSYIIALTLRFDMEKSKGGDMDEDSYRREYSYIKKEILKESYRIALAVMPVIPSLPIDSFSLD